jgi:hypothetical protein
MPNHISLIVAVAMASAFSSACSKGNGNSIPGTGGTPTQLAACQVWPDAHARTKRSTWKRSSR